MADVPKRLLVLDTSVLLVLGGARSRHPDAVQRITNLFKERGPDSFAITAPGLAEAHGLPVPEGLLVLDMNAHAARIAAGLGAAWRARAKKSGARGLNPYLVKADWMILGTAEAWKATALYTEDDQMRVMAQTAGLKLDVRDLPPVPKQPKLI